MKPVDVYWNALGTIGLEHLILQPSSQSIQADSLIVRHHNGVGLRVRYRLRCDAGWRVRELQVECSGEHGAEVWISTDGRGQWFDAQERPLDFLKGCVEIDIMATPFTNTLPIKRLGLSIGQSADIEAAYIRMPDLQIYRARQRYTCLDRGPHESRYLYESLDSGFKAELWVGNDHLVRTYQGVWERIELG